MVDGAHTQTGIDFKKIGKHLYTLIIVLAIIAGISLVSLMAYDKFIKVDPVSLNEMPSNVCGNFAVPNAVAGTPIRINETANGAFIVFADNYALRVQAAPSMYMGRRAVFTIDQGQVIQYALITDAAYHPCPTLAP